VQKGASAGTADRRGCPPSRRLDPGSSFQIADHLRSTGRPRDLCTQGIPPSSTFGRLAGRAPGFGGKVNERLLMRIKGSAPSCSPHETTAPPVLGSGTRRTKTGQLWAYARDDRHWRRSDRLEWPKSTAPNRQGRAADRHLPAARAVCKADGLCRLSRARRECDVQLAFCEGPCRVVLYELAAAGPATDCQSKALERIAGIYASRATYAGHRRRGAACRPRQDRSGRHRCSRTLAAAKPHDQPRRPRLAEGIAYALLSRWERE